MLVLFKCEIPTCCIAVRDSPPDLCLSVCQYEEEIRQLHVQMEQLHSRLSEELPRPAATPTTHVCQPTPVQINEILHR